VELELAHLLADHAQRPRRRLDSFRTAARGTTDLAIDLTALVGLASHLWPEPNAPVRSRTTPYPMPGIYRAVLA
jgi:hypothetical protein